MGQALYRAHRPKSLDTVVGQEHITTTLTNALKTGRISHAYLFTGPRGVGKTSIARIMAYAVNDLPYNEHDNHLDIIEIDAASNRRIDEIRELRDKVNIAPTSATYKVYIIDEVHMLTREAFNALLKTLEEPPAHAIFILATTEAHKLPETIVSRTQHFTFKPVTTSQVTAHLRSLADQENITIDDAALELIARHGEGSFRDSISLLDQARGHEGTVDLTAVQAMLGLPSEEAVATLWQSTRDGEAAATVQQLQAMADHGFAAPHIAKQLGSLIRQEILAGQAHAERFTLLRQLVDVPSAYDPKTHLELALLQYALRNQTAASPVAPSVSAAKPARPAPVTAVAAVAPPAKPAQTEMPPAPQPAANPPASPSQPAAAASSMPADVWPQILAALKQTHNTLYSVVRMAEPVFNGNHLELRYGFAFHQKQLTGPKNQQKLAEIVQGVVGQPVAISCVLDKSVADRAPGTPAVAAAPQAPAADPLNTVNAIFGGGELLQ